MITIGSPLASFVSGPGVACTYAIVFESGDQAMVLPVFVRALLLVSATSAIHAGDVPSPRATIRPDLPPVEPM